MKKVSVANSFNDLSHRVIGDRRRWGSIFGVAMCLGVGCRHELIDHLSKSNLLSDAGVTRPLDDDAGVPVAWGRFAASLDVRPCATANSLVVDTSVDEMDADAAQLTAREGAGEKLSLTEALWIAANRPGYDSITFDELVFPVDAPSTIEMGTYAPPARIQEVCIDGRNRGVILAWPQTDAGIFSGAQGWTLEDGSLQVGLTMLHAPFPVRVLKSQVAGCRIGTDGFSIQSSERSFSAVMLGSGALLGPGNVVASASLGVHIPWAELVDWNDFALIGNSIGFDPTTNAVFPVPTALKTATTSGLVEDNVIVSAEDALVVDNGAFGSLGTLEIRANSFGCDRSGRLLHRGLGVGTFFNGRIVLGPDNVVFGQHRVLTSWPAATVEVTRNTIFANDDGLIFAGTPPVLPPSIQSAGDGFVQGLCSGVGRVELFADNSDQGEHYVGATNCGADGSEWTFAVSSVPSSANFTATFTVLDGGTSDFSAPFAR